MAAANEELSLNVCFSKNDGWASRLIRWFMRAPVSHALITFRDTTLDKVMVMEATGRGFRTIPWGRWRQANTLVARYQVAVPARDQIDSLRRLAEDLGGEYDTISLLGFLVRRWRKRARNPLSDPGKLICSEAVARFLRDAGVPGFDQPDSWTPGDLLAHARENPERFRLAEGPAAA